MSAVESALDVLSRAATMVQEERPKATNLHRKPSSAWRKERRRDPIQSEALDMSHHSRPSVIVSTSPQNGNTNEDKVVKSTSTRVSTNSSSRSTGFRTPGGASDPEIEAHFKRSLGPKKYAAVFNVTTNDKDTSPNNADAVDDHFAKALGKDWKQIQATVRKKEST
ncbi:transcription cofactor vestigial-like protein 4 [Pseudomyrmex gracilis]|uniref:transcription cofactor vestigial-like protein 4 n=1 Tax=Pseudomyrmex gracilis TaxID=219809 RepID=UPI000994F15E|nr:transcription cofactor vestigial-like protein 4 [Pseudomyrmex gracilis]XP_020290230.1 transcription cofactor vestigial-like protein 4 [Pseudomyrmex gracilis]